MNKCYNKVFKVSYTNYGNDNPSYGVKYIEAEDKEEAKIFFENKYDYLDLYIDWIDLANEEEIFKREAKTPVHTFKSVINVTTGVLFKSISEASKFYGIHNSCITRACNGQRNTAGGYRWRYS